MVSDDWLTRASGRAGCIVVPSIELDPFPPDRVIVPAVRVPSSLMGKATTALFASFVRRYTAFPVTWHAESDWGACRWIT